MTECPAQQVANVQEAVRKQYGCDIRVPRPEDYIMTPELIGASFLGLAGGFLIAVLVLILWRR